MRGLQDFKTTLPGLYQDAKTGSSEKIKKFWNDFIIFQFKELGSDASLTWFQRTDNDPPQVCLRYQIACRGIIVAYGAVSAGAGLQELKEQEAARLRSEVLVHNRRVGYVITTIKDDGLKGEFDEVTMNGVLRPLLPTGSQVNLEIPSDEEVFRGLLHHCLQFAR